MSTIMRKVNILSRCEGIYRVDKLNMAEIKPWHHTYILSICGSPGLSQDDLAKHICTNKSNVARNLSFLEENGYVLREHDNNDRRVIKVYPTNKMLEILPRVREITINWNNYIAEDLTEEEFSNFQSVLERLVKKAEVYIEGRDELK